MIPLLLSFICICVFLAITAGMSQVVYDLISECGAEGQNSSPGQLQADWATLSGLTGIEQMVGLGHQHTGCYYLLTWNSEHREAPDAFRLALPSSRPLPELQTRKDEIQLSTASVPATRD
jgi:hypothetical protein